MEPRAERAPPVEPIECAHRGEERLLGDVLSRGRVADDEERRTVGARPVAAEELLERLGRAALRVPDEGTLTPLGNHWPVQPESRSGAGGHGGDTVAQTWEVR